MGCVIFPLQAPRDSPPVYPSQSSRSPSPQEPPPLVEYCTSPDNLGLFRIYPSQPTLFPEQADTIHVVADAPTFEQPPASLCNPPTAHSLSPIGDITPKNLYSAFSSPTAGLLMCWQYSGSNSKSATELNCLWSFIQDPEFDATLHTSFSHDHERKLIEKYLQDNSNPFKADHGWQTSSVPILLPKEKRKWKSELDTAIPTLTVVGVHHHDIINIIISVFEDPISHQQGDNFSELTYCIWNV
ncbi:hypothetical protein PAXINDRAFT_86534 [Paxillus involutus ATCC 200175]|uniref:Uncharacterized protein n=1 Tax=Paxillus involutus ATCC 200175 TaxID=664439 RepID=A0A0C9TSK2_PAXIN|nr:hypothetical protein PAXINDRAFT_86534 [Paxillus involutus ATCC 200175]